MVFMHVMEFYLTTNSSRGETFVTRKITRALAKIKLGLRKFCIWKSECKKRLGTCKDFVEAQWLICNKET